jgi:hypothetical protein
VTENEKQIKQKQEMLIALRVLALATTDAANIENKMTLQSSVGFIYVSMMEKGFL